VNWENEVDSDVVISVVNCPLTSVVIVVGIETVVTGVEDVIVSGPPSPTLDMGV